MCNEILMSYTPSQIYLVYSEILKEERKKAHFFNLKWGRRENIKRGKLEKI